MRLLLHLTNPMQRQPGVEPRIRSRFLEACFLPVAIGLAALAPNPATSAEVQKDSTPLLTYKDVDLQPKVQSPEFAGFQKMAAGGKELNVVVAVVVSAKGHIDEFSLMSSNDDAFAKASMALLPQWKLTPARKNSQ